MKNQDPKQREEGRFLILLGIFLTLLLLSQSSFAHCDSYDGPVIKDAYKAFELQEVQPVLKWVEASHEAEIIRLFEKTLTYKDTDGEVYELLETHFLETLVRLHREGEGEPYTGLKPAGTTSKIISMTDAALQEKDITRLLKNFGSHIEETIREKYELAQHLSREKEESVAQGRAYVMAYVDYTHTVEALHRILEHSASGHSAH